MKHVNYCTGLHFVILGIALLAVLHLNCAECKTIKKDSKLKDEDSTIISKERKLDNFVDFTGDGDQLAVESIGAIGDAEGPVENGKISATGRQCANVQKAVYPVIPVIIASIIGLIGAIIISAIVRLVFKLMNGSDKDDDSSGYGSSGYDRGLSRRNFFGFDLTNINFARLAKNALTAIEKIY